MILTNIHTGVTVLLPSLAKRPRPKCFPTVSCAQHTTLQLSCHTISRDLRRIFSLGKKACGFKKYRSLSGRIRRRFRGVAQPRATNSFGLNLLY